MKLRSRPGYRRGVALFMVLLILFVLTILTGAFVKVNSGNLNLLGNSIQRSQADEACASALQYAWMRLDKEADWAGPNYFTSHPPDENWGPGPRLHAHGSGNMVDGEINGTDMRFVMRVYNNLHNDDPDNLNNVPKRGVRLSIDGMSRTVRRHAEVVLRKRAFVDASAVSQLDLTVVNDLRAMKWNISSADPLLNLIRSNARIYGPGVGLGGGTSEVEFMKHASAPAGAPGPFGMAWAKDDILVEGGQSLVDPTRLNTANTKAKGQFLPKTSGNYQVPDLEPEDLAGPTDQRILPGGTYSFAIAGALVPAVADVPAVPPTLGSPAIPAVGLPGDPDYVPEVPAVPPTPGSPAIPGSPAFQQWNQQLIYTDPNGNTTVLADVPSGRGRDDDYTPVPLDRDVWVPLALDPSTGQRTDRSVVANLRTCQIVVSPGVRAVVPDGDFIVTGQLGSGNLALGTQVAGAEQHDHDDDDDDRDHRGHHRHGRRDGQPKPADIVVPSTVEVVNGDVSIYGAATGWGALVSKEGNVSLRLRNALSTDPDIGVAIYAGKSVTMQSAQQSYGVACSDASFKGLVYSKENFAVFADSQTLSVEGAVVSKGQIYVHNANTVNFKYNADYLQDIILEDTSGGSPTRLEQISFSIR